MGEGYNVGVNGGVAAGALVEVAVNFAIRQRLLQLVNLSLGEARIASEGQLP